MDYEDYEYGGNAVDDMMVDYDCHVNTGELPELFDESYQRHCRLPDCGVHSDNVL
ncbi:MAG: hypothetical protein K2F69_06145 [Bacteroidaceae bacterium]|nr:hypothetical protein [Bacteroidaceae bacterium]